MNTQRLEQLLEFLKDDPNDPFNLYAVATEYRSVDPLKALPYYEKLLQEHPNYHPTYYHVAELYEELGMDDKAENAYKKGIEITQRQGEHMALRELQNAYNEFLFE